MIESKYDVVGFSQDGKFRDFYINSSTGQAVGKIMLTAIFPALLPIFLNFQHYTISHSHLNVDYFLFGVISFFLKKWVTFFLFSILLVVDVAVTVADVAHYPLEEALVWRHQASFSLMSGKLSVIYECVGFAVCIALLFLLLANNKRRNKFTLYTFLALSVFSVGSRVAQDTVLNETIFSTPKLFTSRMYRFYIAMVINYKDILMRSNSIAYSPLGPKKSAIDNFLTRVKQNDVSLRKHNIALIIVESLGDVRDPSIRSAFFSPFANEKILSRYRVSSGTVPFHGGTIDGEFRELCGVYLQRYGENNLPQCLPYYLAQEGFESISYHGYIRYFYDRFYWYPRIGFSRSYFFDDMQKLGLPNCGGAFLGICDQAVVPLIQKQLFRGTPEHPQFAYWMTLTSHLPTLHANAKNSHFDCSDLMPQKDSILCDYFEITYKVFESIAELAIKPELPPTDFIIVGDHAPPYITNFRHQSFTENVVPYFILVSR